MGSSGSREFEADFKYPFPESHHLLELSTYQLEHLTRTFHGIQQAQKSGHYCDIFIVFPDKFFTAHLFILAFKSLLFMRIAETWLGTNKILLVRVNRVRSEVFKILLGYMYTGHLEISKRIVAELSVAALNFEIDEVYNLCICYVENMDAEQALYILITKNIPESCELFQMAVSYALKNYPEIYHHNLFVELPSDVLCFLLCDNRLEITCELQALDSLIKWTTYKLHQRKASFNVLVRCIRFKDMSQDELVYASSLASRLKNSGEWLDLLLEAFWENNRNQMDLNQEETEDSGLKDSDQEKDSLQKKIESLDSVVGSWTQNITKQMDDMNFLVEKWTKTIENLVEQTQGFIFQSHEMLEKTLKMNHSIMKGVESTMRAIKCTMKEIPKCSNLAKKEDKAVVPVEISAVIQKPPFVKKLDIVPMPPSSAEPGREDTDKLAKSLVVDLTSLMKNTCGVDNPVILKTESRSRNSGDYVHTIFIETQGACNQIANFNDQEICVDLSDSFGEIKLDKQWAEQYMVDGAETSCECKAIGMKQSPDDSKTVYNRDVDAEDCLILETETEYDALPRASSSNQDKQYVTDTETLYGEIGTSGRYFVLERELTSVKITNTGEYNTEKRQTPTDLPESEPSGSLTPEIVCECSSSSLLAEEIAGPSVSLGNSHKEWKDKMAMKYVNGPGVSERLLNGVPEPREHLKTIEEDEVENKKALRSLSLKRNLLAPPDTSLKTEQRKSLELAAAMANRQNPLENRGGKEKKKSLLEVGNFDKQPESMKEVSVELLEGLRTDSGIPDDHPEASFSLYRTFSDVPLQVDNLIDVYIDGFDNTPPYNIEWNIETYHVTFF